VKIRLADTLLFLWPPLNAKSLGRFSGLLDVVVIGATLTAGAYHQLTARRSTERMEGVDPVLPVDMFSWGARGALTVGGCSPGRRMVARGGADRLPGLRHDRATDPRLTAVLGFRLGRGRPDPVDVSERSIRDHN